MIKLGILLTPANPSSKYYDYEEAWHLLKSPEQNTHGNLHLQADIDKNHKII
jgi:hypothetical protein